MSLLSDPAYIVHNLRISNLRLDDRTSDKVITFPPQLLSNEYIKAAGPVFPEMQFCSPNISHDYLVLTNNSVLLADAALGSNDTNANIPNATQPSKPGFSSRFKFGHRRIAAQAAAAAVAAGFGRGGTEGNVSNAIPMHPAPVPSMRLPIPMAVASMESDDGIDLDDDEPSKSPPTLFPKMAIPAHVGGGNFAPGIFITTPSRPGSATIPEDAHAHQQSGRNGDAADNTGLVDDENAPRESELMEHNPDIGDMTLDSLNSPIDLSPPDSALPPRIHSESAMATNNLASPLPLRPNTPPPQKTEMPITAGVLSEPVLLRPPPVSLLTSLINQQKSKDDNPFAEEFLRVAGMGEPTPVQLKIYLPSSDKPKDPMQVVVKREATVEDVIGYILYQYYHEGRTPLLSDELSTVVQWNLRIVEDDGEIDDDLPGK